MYNKPITIVTIMLHFTDFAQKYFSTHNVVINKIVSSERRFDDKNVFWYYKNIVYICVII